MQTNRLGCLTITGIISVFVTSCAILGFALFSGGQMFSAGALNAQQGDNYGGVTSHAQIQKCSACHVFPLGAQTMADRCAACHTDIAEQMKDVAKLHGAIQQKSSGPLACYDCHPEHRGKTAALTEMGENTFPHETLGFSLKAHQLTAARTAFDCKDCHHEDIKNFSQDTCDSCHRQMDIVFTQTHVLSFGNDCLACHDGVDRFGDNFNHAAFPFRLNGKHAEAACTKCHLDARTVADLQSAPQDCFSCHQRDDEHDGRFGQNCSACHSPEGWQPAKFDHNLAAFKLEGEHAEAKCEQCHVDNVFKGTPTDCYSCHQKDDEHNGAYGTDCGACHSPEGWQPAKFDHNLSVFKLEGEHAEARCEQCHTSNVFKGTPTDCYSCHQKDDEHDGRFGQDCSACHSPEGWQPAKFDHNLSVFKLEGKHVEARCEQCHTGNVFKGTPTDCYSCHRQDDEHNGAYGTDCGACHTPNDWEDATFDHNLSNFPLTGTHVNTACEKCHTGGQFNGLASSCISCHADPNFHAGAFSTDCASCHNTSRWFKATFNLRHPEPRADEEGSGINHGGATCRQCHPSTVYQSSCVACHENGFEDGEGGGDDDDGDDDDDD